MKILALDSSAKAASVAIIEDGFIVGEFFINTKLTHSQTLVPMVDDLLKRTECNIKDIDAFAVSTGPGSFTGIRIGISAIKGMAMALEKPCIGVSSLEALAYNLIDMDTIICACMDARCDQVYNAFFSVNQNSIERLTDDRAIPIIDLKEDLNKYSKKKVNIIGDGAVLCYNKLNEDFSNINLVSESHRYQKASGVALAAEQKFQNGDFVSASQLLPEYLRLPQAQRELRKRLKLN